MSLNPRIGQWHGRRCWIVGASTGIGAALALDLAERGARVALSARNEERLRDLAARLPAGASAIHALDVRNAAAMEAAALALRSRWGGLDLVVVMAGDYVPMRAWELDLATTRRMIDVNLLGAYHALAAVVPAFLAERQGTVVLVSSVAGYRGLPKSLVYGPTKAALINLAEALWLDLSPRGIGVVVVNPGFVRTPLTAQNDFEMPALIEPEEAAREIVAGLERGDFEIHFPRRFTRWLKLLRLLPYRWYFPAIRKATGA